MTGSKRAGVGKWIFGLCAVLALGAAGAPGIAQEPRAERQRNDPGVLMGERAFRRFEAVTALYGEGKYREALTAADAYLRAELNDYERAMGEQITGFVLIALDRSADAAPRFEAAIALDALPNQAHFAMLRSLAQLYASLERWQDSIDMMGRYLSYQPGPSPEDRVMMAQNHLQLGRFREALPWVRGAIEAAGPSAQESWYQLELAIHFELKDYRAALDLLHAVVARWPGKLRYWELMAGANQELGRDLDAFAALLAAYHGGLVNEQAKILNLVRLGLYVELPFQSGQVLERAMSAGAVEASQANLRLLLQAWTAARDYERAVDVIERLAPLAADGDLYMQKARLMMEQNRWQATLDGARQALALGNVSSPGAAWLLIGIASMELGELREARQAFQRAQEFDESSRRQAREWQRFVEERIQVAELREQG
jgi:tetratricopeptide (TPR) repeat protein